MAKPELNPATPIEAPPATALIYRLSTQSPVGELVLESDGEALQGIFFSPHLRKSFTETYAPGEATPVLLDAERQLQEYFGGWRKQFDLPLNLVGTSFQKQVWRELQQIPFGETISYGDLAHRIGNPKAVRAVGLANGRNPISIVVPCHRVIGGNGSLTGYGGGLDRKEFLLSLEGSYRTGKAEKRGSPGPLFDVGPGQERDL